MVVYHSGDEDVHANDDDDNLRWRKCAKVRQSPARQTKSGKSPAVRQPRHILSTASTDRNTCFRGAILRIVPAGGVPTTHPTPPLRKIKLKCWEEKDSMTKKQPLAMILKNSGDYISISGCWKKVTCRRAVLQWCCFVCHFDLLRNIDSVLYHLLALGTRETLRSPWQREDTLTSGGRGEAWEWRSGWLEARWTSRG